MEQSHTHCVLSPMLSNLRDLVFVSKVVYNNSLCRLVSLHTQNSASEMFAVLNIPSFGELLRKFVFS